MFHYFSETVLLVTTVLTGFYAGFGVFGVMGMLPALNRLTDKTFAEFWQQLDHFMAARMPAFGMTMLFGSLGTASLLLTEGLTTRFWCAFAAVVILFADILVTISVHLPLNRRIQDWDLSVLPPNVDETKKRVVAAFYRRSGFMIGSFVCILGVTVFRN